MIAAFDLVASNAKALNLLGRVDVVDVVRNLTEEAALNCIGERKCIELSNFAVVADSDLLDTFGRKLLGESADLFA